MGPPGPLPQGEVKAAAHLSLPVEFIYSIMQMFIGNLLCSCPPEGGRKTVNKLINKYALSHQIKQGKEMGAGYFGKRLGRTSLKR